ncbi:TPA: N-acetylmuramoyl-L-alanine amidase, partial [Escherichia coli]
PSPLIYDKHKKHCIFRTKTLLSEEKKEDEKCTVSVVFIDHEGYIRNAGIIKHTVPELEEGRMPKINAIILHRTDSSTINGTLASFSKGIGTHFIVEKDGNIYQAASLFVYTSHVGKIKSRCKEEKTWSSEEKKKTEAFGWNAKKIHDHEKIKQYPYRYPYNMDSVGIEVIALYDKKNKKWESATDSQKKSIEKLVDIIKNIYELEDRDVYEHDKISYKTEGEGADLYSVN